MSEYLVMRRANGDLFAERAGDRLRIPVWSSQESIDRFRAHNPELVLFLPARLTRSIISKAKLKDEEVSFMLLSEDAPEVSLEQGRLMTSEEIFSDSQAASAR
jgi:hypothetical protein